MSFLSKFKSNATPSSPILGTAKRNSAGAQQSALAKHLSSLTGPVRPDGSDKFFGFENYGSTCYCNSIVQCLYFSAPFRERILNFPHDSPTHHGNSPKPATHASDLLVPHAQITSQTFAPGPLAANSPARRPIALHGTPLAQGQRYDEKDSPEYKKKLLMQTAPFLNVQSSSGDTCGMQESLFTALKDMFQGITNHTSHTGIVSPHRFLEILRQENEIFRSAMHQDAHEFMNLLLNQVVDSIDLHNKEQRERHGEDASSPPPKGWVHDLFEGLLVSETRCLTCETVSQRDEAFMDLSVDLEAHSSVTSCLRKFSQEEMLCERNKFFCDNCSGLQEAEKRMKIKRLPKILALHLKRFEYTEDYGRLQKLFHRVVYPFHLRLFNTTDDAEGAERLYELYAVVVHIGGGPYHGHYVSIIKTQDQGWLLFDDELVEPVDKSYVQNFFGGESPPNAAHDFKTLACAYVLFYQETTLEAVQREEEAERRASQASNIDTAGATVTNMGQTSNAGDETVLRHVHTATTPEPERDERHTRLIQAVSSPGIVSSPVMVADGKSNGHSMAKSTSTTFGLGLKAKLEVRKEEKTAERERKAAEKEADRLTKARQKEETEARAHRPPSADAMKALNTQSPFLASSTDTPRGMMPKSPVIDDSTDGGDTLSVPAHTATAKPRRATSISLRFWSGSKDSKAQPGLATVPDNAAVGAGEQLPTPGTHEEIHIPPSPSSSAVPFTTVGAGKSASASAAQSSTATPATPATATTTTTTTKDEKDSKRNRFNLARKRASHV